MILHLMVFIVNTLSMHIEIFEFKISSHLDVRAYSHWGTAGPYCLFAKLLFFSVHFSAILMNYLSFFFFRFCTGRNQYTFISFMLFVFVYILRYA